LSRHEAKERKERRKEKERTRDESRKCNHRRELTFENNGAGSSPCSRSRNAVRPARNKADGNSPAAYSSPRKDPARDYEAIRRIIEDDTRARYRGLCGCKQSVLRAQNCRNNLADDRAPRDNVKAPHYRSVSTPIPIRRAGGGKGGGRERSAVSSSFFSRESGKESDEGERKEGGGGRLHRALFALALGQKS